MPKTLHAGILRPASKTYGGVHTPHFKNTAESQTVRMPAPAAVTLPMQQHIGASCRPCVKVGDAVAVGQCIGDSEAYVSAPIHASVSGIVRKITDILLPSGQKTQAVVLESDGEMRPYEGIQLPTVDTPEELLAAVRASGLVGLGGAGFPAHVKLKVPKGQKIDTLIVNAAECEPYITVDYRVCRENAQDIFVGIDTLRVMLDIGQVIIAVEDNKPEALKVLRQVAESGADTVPVRVMALPARYPQGAEKVLIHAVCNRQVPLGALPAAVGVLVMNVASVAFIARYLKTGKPLVTRTLTVDGTAVAHPQNVRVPLGTSIHDLIEFCGGYRAPVGAIFMGGPMMGIAMQDDTLPILKNNNAILAFSRESILEKPMQECIRCGRCVAACPMRLMPVLIEKYTQIKDYEKLEKTAPQVCMECGCCAYVCPAGRPLVQYMRIAKNRLREQGR